MGTDVATFLNSPSATDGVHRPRRVPIRMHALLAGVLAGAFCLPASAALKVFACEPEWGALVRELAGDHASVYVATTALQDPHRIQARPSLVAASRNAQLAVCTGAELEAGWLPLLLRQSGNAALQPGQPGHFEAAAHVKKLDVPTRLDRADGDVHAAGNPHIQTDPRNIALVATALAQRLADIDPANAASYRSRHADFSARWSAAVARWEQQAAPLRGTPVVVQHAAFVYLERWLGLQQVATLEPKPGVEPTSNQLSALLAQMQQRPARMVLRTAYGDPRSAEWFADRARIPVVALPTTVGASERSLDLFGLFDETLRLLLKAVQ